MDKLNRQIMAHQKCYIILYFLTECVFLLIENYLFIHISQQSMALVLGYWKIRGLAQPIRHLLAYTGLEFEEVQYDNPDKWFKEDKINLGIEFPNLPYLIDGDFKLTESSAIARYIVSRSGKTELVGKNVEDSANVASLIGVINDALKDIRGLYWNKDYETIKAETLEKARAKFDYLKKFIGDKDFAIGYLTVVDFLLAEHLYYFEALYPNEKANYPFWGRIRHNVESLPQVKAYYDRPTAIRGPFVPPYASLQPKHTSVKLGYWGIRGLAQIPRLLLGYSGVEFEDVLYTDRAVWFENDKKNLGLNFPNIPYLIDGDFNLTESFAIHRYIVRRWGKNELLGKDIKDNARIESLISLFNEVTGAVKALFWNKDHETAKAAVLEKVKPKLDLLEKSLNGKEFALGYLTLADFVIAEDSNYVEAVFPQESKGWTFFKAIRNSFNNVQAIKAYYASPKGFKGEFYPPSAHIRVPVPEA